ncbi:MAG: SusC/RagA family TonB-linked outer membrane protein, partial [Pedobacter sp.]
MERLIREYMPEEIKTQIDVVLEAGDNTLDELAVVAYGVQKKESVVSSISTVKVSELKVPTRSLTNALAGRVAGVIAVQRSGEPGNDDAQFWIRGVSTFGAGSSPLVLVDGVERPLSNIEPEEIETFSVLKDASATAVYGIRGANGVILVNTRKGANRAPSINFKMESGMTSATRLPELANAPTVYELYNEANLNTNPFFNTQYTPEIIERYKSGVDPILYPDVDWIGTMLKKNAANSRANLNISGGSDFAKYFVSATYYGEDGIWKADDLNAYNTNANLKRYNFRANVDIKLN